jgi:hypothetical protein
MARKSKQAAIVAATHVAYGEN